MTEWSNWSGLRTSQPEHVHRPGTEDEIESIVEATRRNNNTLRPVGSGHSFTDLAGTDERMLSLENYTGLLDLNPDEGRAGIRAGTVLSHLGETLFRNGYAMENLGDIDEQSLAGAISTGTHGTGAEFGVLSTQIHALKMMTPGPGWIECSADENPDVFRAARVSLGSLGVISEITLDVKPAYDLEENVRKIPLETCLDSFETARDENRHVEFFWFPHTDTAVVKTLNETEDDRDTTGTGFGEWLDNVLFELICRTGTVFPRAVGPLNRLSVRGMSAGSTTGPAHRIFPTRRTVRFNEMEYGLPSEDGPEAFRRIKDLIEEDFPHVQFPVEYRYVQGDDIPLSPAHGDDRVFIAVHRYHQKDHEKFFREAERIFREYDGRPHWGKIHYRTADELRDLYPEWDAFTSIREHLDPDGILLNDYLQQLLT